MKWLIIILLACCGYLYYTNPYKPQLSEEERGSMFVMTKEYADVESYSIAGSKTAKNLHSLKHYNIIIYSQEGCLKCKASNHAMRKAKIKFREHMMPTNSEDMHQLDHIAKELGLTKKRYQGGYPAYIINGRFIPDDLSIEEIKGFLKK